MSYLIKCVTNFKNNKMKLPKYAKLDDACVDLQANIEDSLYLVPGERRTISTGLSIELPFSESDSFKWELQIRPRSGLSHKQGITVLNSPGTIDSGYRNEIGVILRNTSDNVFHIFPGDRIAQAKLAKAYTQDWMEVTELSETDRNQGGFGHTGS